MSSFLDSITSGYKDALNTVTDTYTSVVGATEQAIEKVTGSTSSASPAAHEQPAKALSPTGATVAVASPNTATTASWFSMHWQLIAVVLLAVLLLFALIKWV